MNKNKFKAITILNSKVFSTITAGIVIVLAAMCKLYLTSGQHLHIISVLSSKYDQAIFINSASSLISGHWLGYYTNLTLAKGPFYPIFIAITNHLQIPVLLSEQLLYIFACFCFLVAIKPAISISERYKKPIIIDYLILSLLGIILIFNPMSSDASSSLEVLRDAIYHSLTLLTVAGFTALITYRKEKIILYTAISIFTGIFLSAFWITREEGIWLVPFIVGVLLFLLIRNYLLRINRYSWVAPTLISLLPILALVVVVHSVSNLNFIKYGVNDVVEFNDPSFLAAYSSLTRVKSNKWMPVIPVSEYSKEKVYEVSPAFSELKAYLEGPQSEGWKVMTAGGYPQYKGEICGAFFLWDFRDAVADAGYYTSGERAMSYYNKLSAQVNKACDLGKLDCNKSTNSMYPPFDQRYIQPFTTTLLDSFNFTVGFNGYDPTPLAVTGNDPSVKLISKITREPIDPVVNESKILNLKIIGEIYSNAFPIITYVAIAFILIAAFVKSSYKDPLFYIIMLAGMTAAARIALLTAITVTSYFAVNTLYMNSAYPLLIIFDFLSIYFFIKMMFDRFGL